MDKGDIGILIALVSILLAVMLFGFSVVIALILARREDAQAARSRSLDGRDA